MCFVVILHDNVDLYPLTFSPHKISTFVRDFCGVWVWYVWLMAVDINKQFSIQNREQEKNCFFSFSLCFRSLYDFLLVSFLLTFFLSVFFICIHLVVDKLESALVTIFLYVLLQHFRTNLLGKKKTKKTYKLTHTCTDSLIQALSINIRRRKNNKKMTDSFKLVRSKRIAFCIKSETIVLRRCCLATATGTSWREEEKWQVNQFYAPKKEHLSKNRCSKKTHVIWTEREPK